MDIVKVLNLLRQKSGETVAETSELTGISSSTINRYKTGAGIENLTKLFEHYTSDVSEKDFVMVLRICRSIANEITANQPTSTYNLENDEEFEKVSQAVWMETQRRQDGK